MVWGVAALPITIAAVIVGMPYFSDYIDDPVGIPVKCR